MPQDPDIAALEHRIATAFARIGAGLDRLTAPPDEAGLHEALAVEQDANAQLTERLRAVKERESATRAALEARVADLTRQLDVQGIELQRLKKTAIQLRETLRAQSDAMAAATPEAHLINRAMLTELESLRAIRLTETSEMEAILAALAPLVADPAGEAANA